MATEKGRVMEKIYCAFCGKEISADIIAKRHNSSGKMPKHHFHNREEAVAFRKQHNDYARISALATRRSEAVARSNQANPRRRKA